VLYRLPEVLVAVAEGRTVFICEGEKDVEAARALGLVATCNAMGADNGSGNKWLAEFSQYLDGANVVVIPDQDEPGIRHAEWVIHTLKGVAKSVKVVNVLSGKDLADWVQAGATVADIEAQAVDAFEVVADAPASNDISTGFKFFDVADLVSNIQPIDWLVKRFFETDSLAVVYGPPGGGKSFFAVDITCSIATGAPWFSNKVKQGPVFYIAGEGLNGLSRRFRAWEMGREMKLPRGSVFKSGGAMQILDEENVRQVSDMIADQVAINGEVPGAIVIDTLARNFGAGDENSTEDMSKFIQHVDKWLRHRFKCCVIIVHHSGHNMERARGSSALKAAVDSECEVTKDDSGTVRVKFTKMKEAELPEEMMLRLRSIDLGVTDEDGEPVTSAVLDVAGDLIQNKIAERSDKSGITALEVMTLLDQEWRTIRRLADDLECSKSTAGNIMSSLKRFGFINDQGITEEGAGALSRTGHVVMGNGKPVWKRSK
jgi:5S rRNA maturation endonuclease (ribonuclease M5)